MASEDTQINVNDLSFNIEGKTLLHNTNLSLNGDGITVLLGANGAGKTIFLKLLTGLLTPSSGSTTFQSGNLSIKTRAFVSQEPVILRRTVLKNMLFVLEKITSEKSTLAKELLSLMGLDKKEHQNALTLSAGEKQRLCLARAIITDPEILLLDEPTNNLDINTIRWLEDTLNSRESTMIVISHDRRFLNSVCTHMADLDYGEIRLYSGNYDDFMIASTQARERLISDNAKKQAKINELQAFVKRFSANASKAKQATSRANQINKIKLDDIKNSSRVYPFIRFNQGRKVHNKVLEVENIFKSYGDLNVISDFSMTINSGDRIAIIGENGIGKTTLIKCFIDESFSDRGLTSWSENTIIGYFSQRSTRKFTCSSDVNFVLLPLSKIE